VRPALRAAIGALAAACAVAAAGCSSGDSGDSSASRSPASAPRDSSAAPAPRASTPGPRGAPPAFRERVAPPASRERAAPLARAFCPPAASNCRTASGRILYVERVDPDGDGDAHFVLASRDSITGPGISVIDVRRSLRPSPLPGPGDRLSAAGQVYTGSYGQRQIEATELHVAR
jgi:hypothetical protein